MNFLKSFKFSVLALLTLAVTSGFASESEQKERVEKFVRKAVAYVLNEGMPKAMKAFDAEEGEFHQGNMYIFCFDYKGPDKGKNIAHGYKKEFIHKNLLDIRDPTGFYILHAAIKVAHEGGGWIEYQFEDPATGKLANKHAYILPIPGSDMMLGSGYYTPITK